jgi:hypothetical protein
MAASPKVNCGTDKLMVLTHGINAHAINHRERPNFVGEHK